LIKSHRLIFWLLPVVLLAAFGVLNLLANAWLSSSGGKGMLEKEFSSSLGYDVRLTGEYRMSLFPRIAIEGSGIELEAPQVVRLLARGEHYSAAIKLLPFLHREVQISSVALRGGFLDLGTLMAANKGLAPSAAQEISVPQVRSLTIEEFSLVFGDESNVVALSKVQLDELEIGREARLELDVRWLSEGIEMARVALQGSLQLGQALESVTLKVRDLKVEFGDSGVSGLSGTWVWDQSSAAISGETDWAQDSKSAHSQIEFRLGELIAGSLQASYRQSPDGAPVVAEARFIFREYQLEFPEIGLAWAGQDIAGAGCYWLTEPAGLHLFLLSKTLDLDKITTFFPSGNARESDLPFNLSAELQVESATYSGAKGRNVTVKIGSGRTCSDIGSRGP
jgi:uncharacterized protein involved in outer membrane biogenesis